MKIIHCADLHLDSKMETHLTTQQAKERRLEILETFGDMVKFASSNDVRAIIIAGDMFDTPQTRQKRIKDRVLELIETYSSIDFLYLQGNHDSDDFFKNLDTLPSNLKLFTDSWKSYRYDNVVITGYEFKGNNTTDFHSKLLLNEKDVNIVVLHGQTSNYQSDNKSENINIEVLKNKFVDYLALGHIHEYKCEKLDYRGEYCYSGCLEGRGFDECGTKGFVLLDISGNKITKTFHSEFARRKFHEVFVDMSDDVNMTQLGQTIENIVKDIPKSDIVKIIVQGDISEETEVDISYLQQKFKSQFYFTRVVDKTEIKIDYLKYENDISLKGEFIRKVNDLNIDPEEKSKIIVMGINAILGKEVIQ